MNESKKFFLVDAGQIKKLDSIPSERSKPITEKELTKLDHKMLQIINLPSLSEEEKIKRYNQTLTEFLDLKQSKPSKPVIDTTDKLIKKENTEKAASYDPMLGVSKTYRGKAEKLFSYLQQSHKMSVDDKGEVTIKGSKLPGSNITDMITKAVTPNSKLNHLPGWNQFHSFLLESNVPRTLLHQGLLDTVDLSSKNKPVGGIKKTVSTRKDHSQGKFKAISPKSRWAPYTSSRT